jgi:hypothetical protein
MEGFYRFNCRSPRIEFHSPVDSFIALQIRHNRRLQYLALSFSPGLLSFSHTLPEVLLSLLRMPEVEHRNETVRDLNTHCKEVGILQAAAGLF